MRQLFWKEWHELRLLPLAAALCMALLIGGEKVYFRTYDTLHPFEVVDAVPLVAITWGLFALVAGAGLFAQEVGSGSLVFLSALPVSRRRLWGVKTSVAGAALLLSLLASGVIATLLTSLLLPGSNPADLWKPFLSLDSNPYDAAPLSVFAVLDIFAAALAVSPFLDRPISAILAAAVASVVCYGAVAFPMSAYMLHHMSLYVPHREGHVMLPAQRDYMNLVSVTAALPLPVLLAISYWTFTRGETLRSAKRFRVGALTGIVSAGVALAAFWVGAWARWW